MSARSRSACPGGLVLSLAMRLRVRPLGGLGTSSSRRRRLGATLVFLAARYLFADAARRRLGALGERINAGFTRHAFSYLLFLRLVPVFPFFLVNLAPAFTIDAALARTCWRRCSASSRGRSCYVNLGQALGRIDSLHGPRVAGACSAAWGCWRCSRSCPWRCRSCAPARPRRRNAAGALAALTIRLSIIVPALDEAGRDRRHASTRSRRCARRVTK